MHRTASISQVFGKVCASSSLVVLVPSHAYSSQIPVKKCQGPQQVNYICRPQCVPIASPDRPSSAQSEPDVPSKENNHSPETRVGPECAEQRRS